MPTVEAQTGHAPGGPVRVDIRKVVTAHCVNYSAKCTFTLTPGDQKSFIVIIAIIGGPAVGVLIWREDRQESVEKTE